VFSHGYGSNAVLLAIYDNNSDGRGDTEEVAGRAYRSMITLSFMA
jgi:hypothetical protein